MKVLKKEGSKQNFIEEDTNLKKSRFVKMRFVVFDVTILIIAGITILGFAVGIIEQGLKAELIGLINYFPIGGIILAPLVIGLFIIGIIQTTKDLMRWIKYG